MRYIDASRMILREWTRILEPKEFMTLMFIFDRTVGWKKEWERIPYTHFLRGVRSHGSGDYWTYGIKLSRSSLKRALASLEQKGCIVVQRGDEPRECNRYKINLNWSDTVFASLEINKALGPEDDDLDYE